MHPNILIINTNKEQIKRLEEALSAFPVGTIIKCTDYKKIKEYIVKQDLNLIFVDDRAPNELISILKNNPNTKNIPCWVQTTDPQLRVPKADGVLSDPSDIKLALVNCWHEDKIKELIKLVKESVFFIML